MTTASGRRVEAIDHHDEVARYEGLLHKVICPGLQEDPPEVPPAHADDECCRVYLPQAADNIASFSMGYFKGIGSPGM